MKRSRGRAPAAFTTFRRSMHGSKPLHTSVWILGATLLVLLAGVIALSVRRHDALMTWRAGLEESSPNTPWPAWNPSWPNLPRPRNATVGDLRGPYAFAALNAERLRFIPCYCGCAREGHRSALECFVKGFTSQGAPIWTEHAFSCPLCVNILREVSLMTSRGMSLRATREAIDKYHRSMFATTTATPFPQ